MAKYKYKNISDQKIVIINVGEVAPGETIETDEPVNSPNLEQVKDARMVGVDVATQPKKR